MQWGEKCGCLVYLRMLRIQMGLRMWSRAAEIADGCRDGDGHWEAVSQGDVTPWRCLSRG